MLFLDTADEAECAYWAGANIVQGVTTNSTLLRKAGLQSVTATATQILGIGVRELHVQVISEDDEQAFDQATGLAALDSRVRVKIPLVTADGRYRTGLVSRCGDAGIQVNVTACTTLSQGYAALALRPSYVSLLWCRTRDMGADPQRVIEALVARRDLLGADTKILAGSIREPGDATEALNSGTDIVTIPPQVLAPWLHSDASLAMARQFADDALGLEL